MCLGLRRRRRSVNRPSRRQSLYKIRLLSSMEWNINR